MQELSPEEMGLVYDPGQAYRPSGWQNLRREGVVQEREGAPQARQEMLQRAKDIAVEQGRIEQDDANRARQYVDQKLYENQLRLQEREREVQQLETRYKNERDSLDGLMQQQRDLAAKGFGMDRILGSPAGVFGSLLAASGMAVAAAGGTGSGRNAMELHDRNIKNLIRGQEMEWEASQGQVNNAFGKLEQVYGDREQARTALELVINDALKLELQKLQLANADPRIKAAVEGQILEMDQQAEALEERFHERSTGKVTEGWDAGQSGRRAGYRPMTMDERLKMAEYGAKMAGYEADMAESARKMQGPPPSSVPEGYEKWKPEIEKAAETQKVMDQIDELYKMSGFQGIDRNTGRPIGELGDVPGRGPYDLIQRSLPTEAGEKGRMFNRKMKALVTDFIKSRTGAQMTDKEREFYLGIADGKFGYDTLSGLKTLGNLAARENRSAMEVMPPEIGQYVQGRTGRAEVLEPGTFGVLGADD
jgi:hypothetical protein